MTVPLALQNRAVGTVTVIAHKAQEFTSAHEQLLSAMATSAAVALQHAHLFARESRRTSGVSTLVGEMSTRTATTLAMVDTLLQITRDSDAGAQGVERMRQRLRSIIAVQGDVSEESSTVVDLKDILARLSYDAAGWAGPSPSPMPIHIMGARLALPRATPRRWCYSW